MMSADDCSDHSVPPDGAGHGFSSFSSTQMTKLPEDSYSQMGPTESVVEVKQEPEVDDFGVESYDFYGPMEGLHDLGLLPLSPKQSTEEEEEEEEEEAGGGAKLVTVKEENYAEAFGVGGSSSSSSSTVVLELAKPMEGLQEASPPPFLKKTFQMVEDPGTDSIISWSNTRDSFVVWDLYEFSKVLLPQYFKHSNFSSFIRQLNTYGFRKIGSDRWEFANEEFQEGKRHLLKNIKRRSRPSSNNDNKQQLVGDSDLTKLQLQAQVETLKKDRNAMRSDIMKLRRQQEQSQNQISAVEERMSHVEGRQQQILIFLAKAGRNPNFVQQLMMHKRKRKNGSEVGKKRRFLTSQNTLGLPQAMDTNQEADDCRIQVEKDLLTCPNSINEMSSCSGIQNDKDNNIASGKCVTDLCSDMVARDDSNPQDFANYSKIFLELEDLIGKPCEL